MTLFIHEIVSITSLDKADQNKGRIEKIDNLARLPKPMKRKMGRLAQLMFSTVSEIIDKKKLPPEFPLVVGTAYGELEMGLAVLQDIYESDGTLLRPIKVQNSVHVSISGYLGILLHNQGPTLTVSQGRLTAEASLLALESLLEQGEYEQGLVVVGDIYNPQWASTLGEKLPHFQKQLEQNPPAEGAVALVLGREAPIDPLLKNLSLSATTIHMPGDYTDYAPMLRKVLKGEQGKMNLFVHNISKEQKQDFSALAFACVSDFPEYYNCSLAGPLTFIAENMSELSHENTMIISREDENLGCIILKQEE